MNVRRKSLHRKANCKHAKKRANQRAAKERKRVERATTEPDFSNQIVEAATCTPPVSGNVLRFRITVECLNDGERSSFITAEGPHGMTISPTLCGRRVAAAVQHYRPTSQKTP